MPENNNTEETLMENPAEPSTTENPSETSIENPAESPKAEGPSETLAETVAESVTPPQQTVVGIRFKACGKIYTFDANNLQLRRGTKVVVESEVGISIGLVAMPNYYVEKTAEQLKKVIRAASEKDFETIKSNRAFQDEAKAYCVTRVMELNLPMKIVTAETTLDKKRLVYYFTADGRIDFRELVRDLAGRFKTRIEMRQIGVRDEVKLLGGIGVCGRETCCSVFLTSFEPVTIKMAKQQDLSINQSKLSGICGRLMCCLGYECRDGSYEKESDYVREVELITIGEESSEAALQKIDSEAVLKEEPRKKEGPASRGPSRNNRRPETVSPQPDREGRGDRHGQRRRPHGGGHRRPDKERPVPVSDAAEKTVSKQPPAQDKPQQPEGSKGQPFNKRKRFWKKKKPSA